MYSFPYIGAGKVKLLHFPSRNLFGTKQVLRGKQGTVFLTSGKEKLSYRIFCLSALFGTPAQQVRGKQCTVFLTSGKGKLSDSIFPLVLHSARTRLVVHSVHCSPYIAAGKVTLQHFTCRCSTRPVVEILPYIYLV